MVVQKKDGSEVEWEFDKDFYEDLASSLRAVLCQIIVPVQISASSALLTRCRRECAIRFILKIE